MACESRYASTNLTRPLWGDAVILVARLPSTRVVVFDGKAGATLQTPFLSPAPAHNTGAKWRDMLKPNKEANQSKVVMAMGTRRSSVWWRKGRAL